MNEISLNVFAIFPDRKVFHVGRILSLNLDRRGHFNGYFKYDRTYLSSPFAYSLDPISLNLDSKTFEAHNKETGVHGVFSDSLPDSWGRKLLAKKAGLQLFENPAAVLLKVLNGAGLGRLLYACEGVDINSVFHDTSVPFDEIGMAICEAENFQKDVETQENTSKIEMCGSPAGGARPKLITVKNGLHWIAKFSKFDDPLPNFFTSLEAFGLSLAKKVGITVPEFHQHIVDGRNLLLIKRFDVTKEGGRNAMVSFRTLTKSPDSTSASYSDMAKIIAKISWKPKEDRELLYKQMIVNVLLNNTDDHLQNFCMLHTRNGWELSPAYDIVPQISASGHAININSKYLGITIDDILTEGRQFGLSSQKSKSIFYKTYEVLHDHWHDALEENGVPLALTSQAREQIAQKMKFLNPVLK